MCCVDRVISSDSAWRSWYYVRVCTHQGEVGAREGEDGRGRGGGGEGQEGRGEEGEREGRGRGEHL